DPFKEYILKRMNEGCLNAMIILDEIIKQGYTGKIIILRDFMRPHRKHCKQQAFTRFETKPGEQAQVDWGEFYLVQESKKKRVHAFVMVMGYSRSMYVEFVENEKLQTLIECHER
ncbi:IS21 family transposase, partial [Aduncisulcus paluster]